MKFSWPPEEEKSWILETIQIKNNKYYFSNFPKPTHIFLLAYRISQTTTPSLDLVAIDNKRFPLKTEFNSWQFFPWPVEIHTIGTVWSHIESLTENLTLELAYFPNSLREFYMRVLLNSNDEMVFAYRYNKNGKLMWFAAYNDEGIKLPEEALSFPPTGLINQKGIHLLARNSSLKTKKEILSNGVQQ